jgi:hypothetical protein
MITLFPGQEEDEQIYLVVREHWFYLMSRMMIWILFVVILIVFDILIPKYVPILTTAPYSYYIALGKDIFLSVLVLGVFMTWLKYYLNIQLVTSERVVDITHNTIFSHTISELGLEKIEDVTSETTGFVGNIFGFGNVYIQTAGKEERFTFDCIPDPDKLERLIQNLYRRKMGSMKKSDAPTE